MVFHSCELGKGGGLASSKVEWVKSTRQAGAVKSRRSYGWRQAA